MFRVRSEDREFAFRLIDGRMMQWLLATEGRFGFEIAGNAIIAYCPPRAPARLIPLLGTAKGFRDHIPRMVWAEYGQ